MRTVTSSFLNVIILRDSFLADRLIITVHLNKSGYTNNGGKGVFEKGLQVFPEMVSYLGLGLRVINQGSQHVKQEKQDSLTWVHCYQGSGFSI